MKQETKCLSRIEALNIAGVMPRFCFICGSKLDEL